MSTDVRTRIIAATLDLVGAHGIGGLSNRLVAKSAGVSLGTLTYHFASQDALLGEALRSFVDEEVERLSAIVAELDDRAITFEDALGLTRIAIEERPGRRAQIAQLELYLHATRNAGLRDAAARCYAAYDAVAAAVLRGLGIAEADRVAPLLGAIVDGLELRRLAVDDLAVGLVDAVNALVNGLHRPPDRGPG